MVAEKRWLKPPRLLSLGNIEEQSFRKHSRKYRSIEAKNNNENMMYYTGDIEITPYALICKTRIYFNF